MGRIVRLTSLLVIALPPISFAERKHTAAPTSLAEEAASLGGRISQVRREACEDWLRFHGEPACPPSPTTPPRPCAAARGGELVSVAHYGEQNGDAMRDPEVVFEFVARGWHPGSIQQEYVGSYREAVFVSEDGKVYVRPAQGQGRELTR